MPFYGLTGGICTGKSTASKILSELGAHIIDADEIARELLSKDSPLLKIVAKTFGEGILNPDGSLNREELGRMVFSDKILLNKLNLLTHPLIIKKIREKKAELERTHPNDIIILDAPLLYETELDKTVEKVIVISSTREEQMRRLIQLRGMKKEDAENRINSQMPIDDKVKRADYVIDNSGTIDDLRRQVEDLFKEITSL
ncbi:MAG: dephospho-CoA kinase [Candidatus Schekmanbacteria bacterium]|nr:MAG: dephospho-CoA kinase [Candidatus Schekmanbacteria bacterium]